MNPRPKRISLIEEQRSLARDVSGPSNRGDQIVSLKPRHTLKYAPDYALLPPSFSGSELSVGDETGQFCAGARAAGRAIIGAAGAKDKVACVNNWVIRRAEKLDVIDQASLGSRNALALESCPDAKGKVGQAGHVVGSDFLSVLLCKEEPVATPRHVARNGPMSLHLNGHVLGVPKARHVVETDLPVPVVLETNHAHGCVQQVTPLPDTPEVSKRHDQPDGPMPTHVEDVYIVEEHDARDAIGFHGLHEQAAHQDLGPARLENNGGPKVVELLTQLLPTLGEGTLPKIGTALDHDTRGFASRVGIDDLHRSRPTFGMHPPCIHFINFGQICLKESVSMKK